MDDVRSQAKASSSLPRRPARKRGRIRFDALIVATAEMLAERDIGEVGLYDIAKQAGVPPASAYHFLPTKEAAFLALAERYLGELRTVLNAPLDRAALRDWPDLIRLRSQRAVGYINGNVAYRKLILSGSVSPEIHRADVAHVQSSAASFYDWLDEYFVMPDLPRSSLYFSAVIGIYDGIWMTSYARHGIITDDFAEQALTAVIAYCRSFLPETLTLRQQSPNRPRADTARVRRDPGGG